jgi:diguanylate cyclase (GGDEF)-like protein
MNPALRLLIVEDNPGDARLIQEYLRSSQARFSFAHVDRLSRAAEALHEDAFDAILLDLSLPDSRGLDTFLTMRRAAPATPILVLTGTDDEALAVRAVEEGAQDYLVKGLALESLLGRSVLYAVERHKLQTELRGLAIVDPVTGLYNGRGFPIVAEQSMRLARRFGKGFMVAQFGVDAPEARLGPDADLWLMEIAERMRASLEETDVAARVGESRFAFVAIDDSAEAAGRRVERLRASLASWAAPGSGMTLTFGAAPGDASSPLSDYVARAEAASGEAR